MLVFSHPLVSIVVANYNGKDMLEKCLKSLEKLRYSNYEVIVVDDGSTDSSASMVETEFPNVKSVKLKENIGLAGANNKGISVAQGDIIVFDLNNDEVVDRYWLDHLVKVLMSSRDIGITCGKRYQAGKNFVRKQIILSAGSKMNFVTAECVAIGYGKKDSEEFNIQKETDFATLLAVKREVFEKIGVCDPVYRNYYEDSDFSIRAKKAGYKIVYVPTALSWHIGSSTFGKYSLRRYYLLRRNQIRFIIKNFSFLSMILGLMYCFFVKTIRDSVFVFPPIRWIATYLFPRSRPYIHSMSKKEILKMQRDAFFWNLANLRSTFRARWSTQKRIRQRARRKKPIFSFSREKFP